MSEAKHTPGDWGLRVLREWIDEVGGSVAIDARDWSQLATVHIHCSGRSEGEANAQLIAAAPDLLAACEAVVAAWEREANERGGIDEAHVPVLHAVLGAVIKAKGGA